MTELPDSVAAMLRQGRMVHALCIEGDADASLELARDVAGAVLCEQQQGAMCGTCLHCRKVLAGVHSDLCQPDPGTGDYKKDAVRALRGEIYRSPHEARAKVLLLRDAQSMSAEVQNLLLKVMEEPPEDTYFLLTCDNRYRLLPTVLSRLITVTLPQKPESELLEALLESETGQSAQAVLEAMQTGGYKLLAAMQPSEKNRARYGEVLQTVQAMLAMAACRERLGIATHRYVKLRAAVATAIERNESNGYLPLITAALAEQCGR